MNVNPIFTLKVIRGAHVTTVLMGFCGFVVVVWKRRSAPRSKD
jgi:hypothetical protein